MRGNFMLGTLYNLLGRNRLRSGILFKRSFLYLIICICFLVSGTTTSFGQEGFAFTGITEPITDVILSLPVEGRIAQVFFKEGEIIKNEQVILELDKELEDLEVERRKLIWQSKAELESAIARVNMLKSQLDSTKELFENTGSVSREELEEKELEYNLAIAEKNRIETEEEKQRIEYEMALQNQKRRKLISPVNGVIVKLFLDAGESVEAGESLVHVVDIKKCLFISNVDEQLGRSLKKGQVVTLAIGNHSSAINKKGIISFISPVADPASGLLEVKVEFENNDHSVRPGIAALMKL